MTIKETLQSFGFTSKFLAIPAVLGGTLILLAVAQIEQNNAIRKQCNTQTHKLIELRDTLIPQLLCVSR